MNHGKSNLLPRWSVYVLGYLLSLQILSATATITVNWTATGYAASGRGNYLVVKGGAVYGTPTVEPASTSCFCDSGTFSFTAYETAYYWLRIAYQSPTLGEINSAPVLMPASFGTTTYTLTLDAASGAAQWQTNAPATTNCYTCPVVAPNDYCKRHYFYKDSDSSLLGFIDINPGEALKTFTHCVTTGSFSVRHVVGPCDGDPAHPTYDYGTNQSALGWVTNSTAGVPNGAPITTPGQAASTNLGFSGASGAAKDSTLQEGFSALRDVLVEGFNNDAARQGIQNSVLASVLGYEETQSAGQAVGNAALSGIKNDTAAIVISSATIANKASSMDISLGDIRTGQTAGNLTLTGIKSDTGNLPGIKTDTGGIKTDTAGIKSDTVGIKTDTGGIKTDTAGIRTDLSGVNTKLTDLANILNGSSSGLPSLASHADLVTANTHLGNMEVDLSYTRGAVVSIDGKMTTVNTSLSSIDARASTANTYLSSIVTAVNDSADATAGLGTKLDTINTSVGGVGSKVQTFNDDFRSFTNMFKDGDVAHIGDRLSAQHSAAEAAADATAGLFTSAASGLAAPTTGAGSGSALAFTVAGFHFDGNPLTHPTMGPMASAIKSAITWFVTAVYVFCCWKCTQAYLMSIMQVQQAKAPDVSIFGNNFGLALGIPIAIAMTVAIAAVPAVAMAVISTDVSALFGSHPLATMSSAGSAGSTVMYLVNGFLPIDVILVDLVAYLTFSLTVASVYSIAATIVRFLIG